MVLGARSKVKRAGYRFDISKEDFYCYCENVLQDFKDVKNLYPFCYLTILPTVSPHIATASVIAANRKLIESVYGTEEDFLGEYSRKLFITIPYDYRSKGCNVYGGIWLDEKKIPFAKRHFYNKTSHGYELCVGVPDSFRKMKNVFLENIRTAEHILTAYADYLSGNADSILMIAYSHGNEGIKEFEKNKRRYHG